MVRTWYFFLDLLWPTTPRPPLGSYHVSQYGNIVYLFSYSSPTVRTLIHQTKYHGDHTTAKKLASQLDTYLDTLTFDFVIIPIPISYRRWRERGYNQIELICRHSTYKHLLRSNILHKRRHTKRQTYATRAQRMTQQTSTFGCNPSTTNNLPAAVILLDDVVTTGGTMAAAQAALQNHLPPHTKIISLALAH